jgi:hypothetical protein
MAVAAGPDQNGRANPDIIRDRATHAKAAG